MEPLVVDRDRCVDLMLGEAVDDQGLFHVAVCIGSNGVPNAECILRPVEALGFGLIVIYRALKGILFKR